MKRQGPAFIVIAGIILLAGFTGACRLSPTEAETDCEIDKGSCTKRIGNTVVTFDVHPKPIRVMKLLSFTLIVDLKDSTSGAKKEFREVPDELTIYLGMPGMYMGRYFIPMKKGPDGIHRGEGVIPRCPSGKKLWLVEADIPQEGKIGFTFNVSD